jgi:hypothetical protein
VLVVDGEGMSNQNWSVLVHEVGPGKSETHFSSLLEVSSFYDGRGSTFKKRSELCVLVLPQVCLWHNEDTTSSHLVSFQGEEEPEGH